MRRLLLLLVALLSLLIITACFNSDQSNGGVARINNSNQVPSIAETNDKSKLTNEERATQFVECMRDLGYKDVTDPTLNADGSIDWGPIKQTIGTLNKKNTKLRNAYDNCTPLLENMTRTKSISADAKEETKDQLLEFAECLRENDLNVPDPDFSIGADMKGFLSGLNENSPKVKRVFDECLKIVYGTSPKGEKK